MMEGRSEENTDFILSMTGSYSESLKQMSGVDCFMQGRRNRMSSRAGKDKLGTRYFVSPTVCNQIYPKDTVRVDRVKDSKSSKPEKTKF